MGSTQRLAAVAAVSHARHYYNHTQPDALPNGTQNGVNIFFVSATLCGVLVAVCAACWKRSPGLDKPDEVVECRGVYTVSADIRLHQQMHDQLISPPPAYEVVVDNAAMKDCHSLQEILTEPCPPCQTPGRPDSGLPSYEAAVMLRDTKL